MQKTHAITVIKAASRLKVLAEHARERLAVAAAADAAAAEQALALENGDGPAAGVAAAAAPWHGGASSSVTGSPGRLTAPLLASPNGAAAGSVAGSTATPATTPAAASSSAAAAGHSGSAGAAPDSVVGGSPLSGRLPLTPRSARAMSRPLTPALSDADAISLYSNLSGRLHPHKGGDALPWYKRDAVALKEMIFSSRLNALVLCVPLGVAAQLCGWGATATFLLNFLSLIPLALLLGDVTEDLAVRFGDTVGGLLNATFGNVVEMILSVAALQQGLYTVVASSLLGSILSNLLLVLGCCFLFGGIRYKTQAFNAVANQATSSLLFLSCMAIIVPTAAVQLAGSSSAGGGGGVSSEDLVYISRGTAVLMLIVYGCYLGFQLHTHHDLFSGDDDGDEQPLMTFAGALATLSLITAAVAVCSTYLCGSIEEFSARTGLSQAFLGIIVLPIAGNACEHITAVLVAMKNKMDLSLGVAVGSSIQIAIFAIPFVVVVGWVTGHDFTLDFDPFATLALTVSVIHANFVTSDARSHWLMGVSLISAYLIIALVFLYK